MRCQPEWWMVRLFPSLPHSGLRGARTCADDARKCLEKRGLVGDVSSMTEPRAANSSYQLWHKFPEISVLHQQKHKDTWIYLKMAFMSLFCIFLLGFSITLSLCLQCFFLFFLLLLVKCHHGVTCPCCAHARFCLYNCSSFNLKHQYCW